MSYIDLLNILSKPWASINEIKLIARCGRDTAISVRNAIEKEISKNGKQLPTGKTILVPMKKVIDYFGLDINHIVEMATIEKSFHIESENRTNTYASISR